MAGMRVLVASDAFDPLTPSAATDAIAEGWSQRAPHVQLTRLAMSDGGRGFADVMARLDGAQQQLVTDHGLLATLVTAPDGTVYVEAAQGLAAGETGEGGVRSSYGVGLLLRAVERPRRLVVGVGGLGCLDGGLGMLQALADRPDQPQEGDLSWLPALRERWAGAGLVAAVHDDLALLGFQGAAARAIGTLGLSKEEAQEAEQQMGAYVDRVRRVVPAGRDLLTGTERRLDRQPGAGAGGGLGYGLSLLGAALRPGPEVVAHALGLPAQVAACDLVVTGTRVFDWRVLQHSVLAQVASAAATAAVPVVVLSHEQRLGRREVMNLGVAGAYSVVATGRRSHDAGDPTAALSALAHRVAGTWTPLRGEDVH